MDGNDKQAIKELFARLAAVEKQAPPRDPEADAYIREQIIRQAGAPYYMAQTIVMQQQALEAAHARVAELESGGSQSSGGSLFDGLLGERHAPRGSSASVPRVGSHASRPASGFLAGAAQTALGVAGGVLLGNIIAGAFGGGEAEAGEPEPGQPAENTGFDDGGDIGEF